jgi:hypothetical protein
LQGLLKSAERNSARPVLTHYGEKMKNAKEKMHSDVTICTVALSGGTITPDDGADCTGPKQSRVFP